MSEATNNNLTVDALMIGDPISQHHGIKCCPAIHEATEERYIVKFISIPASQVQLDALLLTGAYPTPAQAMEYFRDRAEEVLQEVKILNKLHTMEGFLPFTQAEIRQKEDGVGFEVCLISPYKRSLARQMQLNPLTHLGAVNLGLDLCAALAICRRAGYLYVDLKPSNIYITPTQGYRISDLGFITLSSLKYASYPEQYRSSYTAPEIVDAMSTLNDRIDIYALGLILYQVYNNCELPAELGGELPPPAYADYEIAEIILKACHPDPEKRWADPLQMGQAIVAYMQRNNVNDTPIVPPPVEIPPEPVTEEVTEPDTATEVDISDDPVAMLASILSAPAEPVVDLEAKPEISVDVPKEDSSEADTATVETEDVTEEVEAVTEEVEAVTEEADLESSAEEDQSSDDTAVAEGVPVPLISDEAEQDDISLDLSFIADLTDDETAPTEENTAEIKIDLVSEEVQDMLARADELISHELPEPAVAPDPIDVPFPPPIVVMDDTEEDNADSADAPIIDISNIVVSDDETEAAEDDQSVSTEDAEDAPTEEVTEDEATVETEAIEDNTAELEVSEYYSDRKKSHKKHPKLVRNLLIIAGSIALLIALIIGGIMFYQQYYLQPINSFLIDGSVDSLTVELSAPIGDDLLTVVCTDTFGNTRTQKVVNGRVHFTNLAPNTQYRVEVKISGFHRLTGATTGTYTTAAQTEILNFTAVAGPEDGSVKLSFAVNGPDTDYWTIAYSTGNSPEEFTAPFPGHTVIISNLTVNSEYLFRLIPSDEQYLTGTWMLRYTAPEIIYAQELAVNSFKDGVLVAAWKSPEGMEVQSWTVRCYNENGYDQTITTTETQVEFTELDHAYGYIIEVTADGMTQSTTTSVTANPITITSVNITEETEDTLTVTWDFSGQIPEDGWVLNYSIDGSEYIPVECQNNSAQISKYPGSLYQFDVIRKGNVTFFGMSQTYQVSAPGLFSGYEVEASEMDLSLFLTPAQEDWQADDLVDTDFTNTFKAGDKAAVLVQLQKKPKKSEDSISIVYVVRDENGVPVSLTKETKTWKKLWDGKLCTLVIPTMPNVAGNYTIDIYMNDQQINIEPLTFSIT